MSADSIPNPFHPNQQMEVPNLYQPGQFVPGELLNPGGNALARLNQTIHGSSEQTDYQNRMLRSEPSGEHDPTTSDTWQKGPGYNPKGDPGTPELIPPDALSETPTAGQASTSAFQNQLMAQKHAYLTSTYLTGGQGLLDPPNTTSQVLLGN